VVADIAQVARRAVTASMLVAATLCVMPGVAPAASEFSALGPVTSTVDSPRSVAFSSSGQFVAAAGASGPLSRYALTQGGALSRLPSSNFCSGSSVAFKPTGNVLASADAQASTVTLCSVSGLDGSITPLGSPLPTSFSPISAQFSPDGKLLATLDYSFGYVSMFTVGPTALAPVGDGEGFDVGFLPSSATFSLDGRFLIVTSNCPIFDPKVLVFAVAADGTLTQTQALAEPDICAQDVAFDPSDGTLVVLNSDRSGTFAADVTRYALSADGRLTRTRSPVPAGTHATNVAYSPDGKLVAYTSFENDTLTLMRELPSGALAPAMTVTTGDGPSSVTFSADGALLAVTTREDDSLALFRLAPGPVLLPAGSPADLSGAGNSIAVAPNGRVAVSTFNPDGVNLFSLDAGGKLTPGAALGPAAVVEPHAVALSPNGQLLAVGSGEDALSKLSTFTFSGGGVPTLADSETTGAHPVAVEFSPDGSLLATADVYGDSVSLFSVAANGVLTLRATRSTGDGPRWIAFSPDGTLLLTADEGSSQLSVFAVSGTTLVSKPPIGTDSYPQALAFRPGGGQFALISYVNHSLTTYTITSGGIATPVAVATGIGTPERISWSPSGDLVAITGDPGDVFVFTVSPAGVPMALGDVTTTDSHPIGIAFDATGKFMLIPQIAGRTLWVYPLAAPTLDTVIDSGPPEFDNTPSPEFKFDASYPSTYECKLDTGAFSACARSPAIPIASEGAHTLSVRARDALGNLDPTPASYPWTSDRVAPTAPAPQAPADGAPNLAPTVQLSWATSVDGLSGVTGYELFLDGVSHATVAPATCLATCLVTLGPLANGAHSWEVAAKDAAGNVVRSAARDFAVDALPPAAPSLLTPVGGAAVGSAQPTLSWLAATDAGAGVASYDVAVDATVLHTSNTSIQAPANLADGPHTWGVVAIDAVGNRSEAGTGTFVVDTTPPVARLAVGPRQTRPGVSVTLDAHDSSDAGAAIAGFAFDTDGDGSFERFTGTSPTTTTVFSAPGTYQVGVRVSDRAGLAAQATFAVTIVAPPNIVPAKGAAARFLPAKATSSRSVKLVLSPPAGASAYRVSNEEDPDGAGILRKELNGPKEVEIMWTLDRQTSPGKETKLVYVWFERGTELVHAIPSIVLDEIPPVVTATLIPAAKPRAKVKTRPKARVKIKARDPSGTGVNRIRISRKTCSGVFKAVGSKARVKNGVLSLSSSVPKGSGAVRVQVRDAVGNRSPCSKARAGR
jgi:6-phosphogluconolactonase (cycloisomerase 2 family)/PKD repeat protein